MVVFSVIISLPLYRTDMKNLFFIFPTVLLLIRFSFILLFQFEINNKRKFSCNENKKKKLMSY
jgi:hypothetical protein